MKSLHSPQPHHSLRLIINISVSIIICLSFVNVQSVSGAPPTYNYYVDTTTDSNAAGFRACDSGVANDCSMRGAIAKVNSGSTSNSYVIHLSDEIYSLTVDGSDRGL